MAKHFGAKVTGISSTENLEFVRSIGADDVIDYRKTDFTKVQTKYDLIIDLVGNRKVNELVQVMTPKGICVLVGMDSPKLLFKNVVKGSLMNGFSGKKVVTMDAQVTNKDLSFLASLFAQKKLKACIEHIFPFESIKEAFEHIAKRRTKGKIVVRILK